MIETVNMELPLLGRKKILLEKIETIESNWHVEVWVVHYYFLRMEIFSQKKEIIVRNKENIRK
jgi:hypothetical protein